MRGELTIKDYPNLELLSVGHGHITKLEIINCPKLTQLGCEHNELTNLDLSKLSQSTLIIANDNQLENIKLPITSEKLVHLNIVNNNFPKQDLTVFSRFINLEKLWIGNNEDGKIQYGIRNRFTGSLEPLKDMDKLKVLDISNTDIDSEKELKKFGEPINTNYSHLLLGSSSFQSKETKQFKTKQELEEIIKNKRLEISELEQQLNNLQVQEAYVQVPPKNN
ncbi:32841_t:CDS:2 [Racocetra persica]|uniref:32841_t:CDS:1 n=1 Tax=Racocetra persica TaxID=160502 RepID=A0ACA9MU24_9GLOM|nr:32841_t:CDS:2 [Racocetra persica]